MEEPIIAAQTNSHLFVLRIWSVTNGTSAPQWRSRLQNIQNGEVNYFKDLESLRNFIDQILHEENQTVA